MSRTARQKQSAPQLSVYLFVAFLLISHSPFWLLAEAALLQGCNFGAELCDEGEVCVSDGLFGQCYNDGESDLVKPLVLEQPLGDFQDELLRTELTRLANNGFDWPHARSQCVLAYFKLSVVYQLDYDTEFCSVRNPNNIWSLIQRVQNILMPGQDDQNEVFKESLQAQDLEAVELPEEVAEQIHANEDGAQVVFPVILINENEAIEPEQHQAYQIVEDKSDQLIQTAEDAPKNELEKAITKATMKIQSNGADDRENTVALKQVLNKLSETTGRETEKRSSDRSGQQKLSVDDEAQLDQYLGEILNNRDPDLKALNSNQLEKLLSFIGSLQTVLAKNQESNEEESAPEIEEIIPLASKSSQDQLMLLKKDTEKFSNDDMGLANTEHRIVKGGIQRVEGNRVYLKVAKDNITEEELYKLIAYLDHKIAEPNSLYFDEFLYENGQLSFRISRAKPFQQEHQKKQKIKKELENASGVAQAVYKRRKDIQTLAGIEVDETGIGSGVDVVPVEKAERDWLFVPILAVCALTIASLVSVLAVHIFYRNRRHSYKSNMPEVIDHLEGKPCTVYEDLCRQRMNTQDVPIAVSIGKATSSKHSSTSSWPDECLLQTNQMDISTGHVILSFLQDCLKKPNEISDQWISLEHYESNTNTLASVALSEHNADKNFDKTVVPYDDSLVVLNNQQQKPPSSFSSSIDNVESEPISTYINASKIHDADPKQVAYVATQSPLQNTANDFWQMVWEQGIALIVNLCDQEDMKSMKCIKYWPEEGSKVYGKFEIYLVSEHIWSEDYVVRSLYLKNNHTGETRTITQFHYLAWPDGGVPLSIKSLLEFRRKISKSYRGHSSPVLVHCTNGAGRTGTYCLIDMAISRILKGVKELNIAGSLEYLRDQRMRMVENEEQYKFVFSCVAEEVSSLLKNLQH